MTRSLDVRVTVATVHAELADVQFVVVGNRLIRLIPDAGVFRSEIISDRNSGACAENGEACDDLEQDGVTPTRKEIGHFGDDIYELVKNFTRQNPKRKGLFSQRTYFEVFCNHQNGVNSCPIIATKLSPSAISVISSLPKVRND